MRRLILLLTLVLLTGCDAAVAALIMSSQKKSSDDGPPLPAPSLGFADPVYKAWIANLADPGEADLASADLIAADGNPAGPLWTELGNAAATFIFDPSADPASFNTILLQVSSTQNYDIDCIEILDSQNRVVEHASGTVWSDFVTAPDAILGPPDGTTAVTTAAGASRAFIFTRFTGPIDRFRINGRGDAQPPSGGDILATGGFASLAIERPGGMAIDANGLIHLTLSVGNQIRLVRFGMDAVFVDEPATPLATNVTATQGSHSVALNPSGVIFTAATVSDGDIQVRRIESDLTMGPIAGFTSTLGGDRVEHNSIAVDSSGNLVVVGGMNSFDLLGDNLNHWRIKLPDTVTGTPLWQSSASSDSSNSTYWHAVTTGVNDEVFTTGDRFDGTLLGGTNQVYTTRFNSGGGALWSDEYSEGDQPPDVGHAIALDASGNFYVAGSAGTDTDGRDGLLLRYSSAGVFSVDEDFTGGAGNDEFLDLAVDTDGSIYVVGYTTVPGQGENIWIRKYVYSAASNEFNTVWTRTHNGPANGNDRAVSVAIFGSNLVVAGYETNGAGQAKLVLRVYAK